MILLVIFIFGAIILGAGVMLSPAWLTSQPRVGLSGSFALALVIGGAVFWSYLFGWDTLVVDYMLFALVTGIFLGGTLSIGQSRAEKRGETLSDAEQGWTGPEDILFFTIVGLMFVLPILIFNMPFGNADLAYIALTTKLSGTFNTLAPFQPEVTYSYPPGFSAISAYISHQLFIDVRTAQVGIAAVVGLLCIWVVYDFGSEVRDKRFGRALAVAMLLGFGLFNIYFRSDFTALLGTLFALTSLTYTYRYQRDGHWSDLIAAGLMFGAIFIVYVPLFWMMTAGYGLWMGTMWLAEPRPVMNRWWLMLLAIPGIAALATAPYLLKAPALSNNLFDSEVIPQTIFTYHSVLALIFAAVGLAVGLRDRTQLFLLSAGLLIAALVFAVGGNYLLLTIPLTLLGGIGLMWLWDTVVLVRVPEPLRKRAFALVGIMLTLAAGGLYAATSLPQPPLTADDLAVMEWLKQNADPDALIYNPYDAWTVMLTERNSVNTPHTQSELESSYDYMVVLSKAYEMAPPFDPAAIETVFTANNATVYRPAES